MSLSRAWIVDDGLRPEGHGPKQRGEENVGAIGKVDAWVTSSQPRVSLVLGVVVNKLGRKKNSQAKERKEGDAGKERLGSFEG